MYNDWYLPSKDELDLMYQNLHLNQLGGFSNNYYWSSSESDSNNAWRKNFTDSLNSVWPKDNDAKVRAIRSF